MIEQLGPQDAQFLFAQSGNTLTHVMSVNVYDPASAPGGTVRFKDIIAHVASRVATSPVFRRKLHRLPLDFDFPYWVEDRHFDLEAHISHARLPKPGDWRQFCIQVARHFSRPMDMTRPLWDIYVVEGLDHIPGIAPGSFATLTRIHHAAIDGASGTHFFVALSDRDAAGNPVIDLAESPVPLGAEPDMLATVTRAMNANLTSPVRLMQSLMKLTPGLLRAAQTGLAHPGQMGAGVPQTRFNAPLGPAKVFDAAEFPLAELSAIRALVPGATINDVVLTICAGALRRYLAHHGELPDEPLVATAPVNLRTTSAEASRPGNNISAMSIRLPTDLADPVARLAAVRAFTVDAKEARAGLSARVMTDLTKHIPGATMALAARMLTSPRFAPRASNLFISNVPGPQFPLFMAGARITHQYGLAPLSNNMGLFIATPSYDGKISFCVTADRAIMPDVAYFRACIEEAQRELLAAAAAAGKPAPAGDKPAPAGDKPIPQRGKGVATAKKRVVRSSATVARPRRKT